MARRTSIETWSAVAVRRRWGCFLTACFLGLVVAAVLALLIWIVRPRPAVHPLHLIGSDVDGLVLIELSRSSPRVNRLVQTLIRPISYEVQSRPQDLEQQASHLLDVMTFRRAIGLLRYDPLANREQWAWVIALKRMGDLLKALIEQLAAKQGDSGVEMETSGGVLLFWGKQGMPCFAVDQRAFVVASDRDWLREVLARLENPLEKTPQAKRLYGGLPDGGKHCIARACVLLPRERWNYWAEPHKAASPLAARMGRIRGFLEKCGLRPAEVQSLALATTVQPRGQLEFSLRVCCADTSAALELGRRAWANWPDLSALLKGPDVADIAEPTTTSAGVVFGWTTPRVEQMLGLGLPDTPTTSSR